MSYNIVMTIEGGSFETTSDAADKFVRDLPILDKTNRRILPRYHPEGDLDPGFKRVFYIGDFLRTHFSGRILGEVNAEGLMMIESLPTWSESKIRSIHSPENKYILHTLSLEQIEEVTGVVAKKYSEQIDKAVDHRDEAYEDQYIYWNRLNEIALAAIKQKTEILDEREILIEAREILTRKRS